MSPYWRPMADRARWLLYTHEGRIALGVAYSVAAVVSIATYTIARSPLYGVGQLVLTSFGLLWARWCLQRP